jgi:hypothetical protein
MSCDEVGEGEVRTEAAPRVAESSTGATKRVVDNSGDARLATRRESRKFVITWETSRLMKQKRAH